VFSSFIINIYNFKIWIFQSFKLYSEKKWGITYFVTKFFTFFLQLINEMLSQTPKMYTFNDSAHQVLKSDVMWYFELKIFLLSSSFKKIVIFEKKTAKFRFLLNYRKTDFFFQEITLFVWIWMSWFLKCLNFWGCFLKEIVILFFFFQKFGVKISYS